jgi:uncharacterized protein (TIGR03435 family)
MARSIRFAATLLLYVFGATPVLLRAQPAPQLAFDVTSVKVNKSADQSYSNIPLGPGDVYSSTGGRFTARGFPLVTYLFFAYKISGDQSQAVLSQLPGWATTDRFDIAAKTDGDPAKDTKDQMRLMLQSLLAERFGLKARSETKQVPVFAITLAKPGKTGPQLRAHPKDLPCSTAIPSAGEPGPDATVDGGFPAVCGGFLGTPPSVAGRFRMGARNVTMEFIDKHLISNFLNRPVIDRTGLSGTFDVVMEWTLEVNGPQGGDVQADPTGPTFLEALGEQLGLKAESQKGPAQVLVIDHVDHPSEN